MSDLPEFLLARIAEDEDAAQAAADVQGADVMLAALPTPLFDGLRVAFPARVLAECEAKRRIMESLDYTPCPCQIADRCVIHDASAGPPEFAVERFVDPVTDAVLHALALPYAGHPDYREEWRP